MPFARARQALDAALSGLERCRRDCRVAVRTTPATSDSSLRNTLEFDLPDDQQDSLRLPNPALVEPLPAWNPLGALVRIRFEVIDQTLWRAASIKDCRSVRKVPGFRSTAAPVLDPVSGARLGRNLITVEDT